MESRILSSEIKEQLEQHLTSGTQLGQHAIGVVGHVRFQIAASMLAMAAQIDRAF